MECAWKNVELYHTIYLLNLFLQLSENLIDDESRMLNVQQLRHYLISRMTPYFTFHLGSLRTGNITRALATKIWFVHRELGKFIEKKESRAISLDLKAYLSYHDLRYSMDLEIHADFRNFKVGGVADPSTIIFSQVGGRFLLARNADRI